MNFCDGVLHNWGWKPWWASGARRKKGAPWTEGAQCLDTHALRFSIYYRGPLARLDQLIARNTGLSRKAVMRLLKQRRITTAGGEPIRASEVSMSAAAFPEEIRIDDEPVPLRTRHHVMQHKPVGVVTALKDREFETAYGLLQDEPLFRELRAVGRLDRDCSGLLIWTTDGDLVHRMGHPKYAVERTYQVALTRPFEALPKELVLEDGHRPDIKEVRALTRDALHPALVVPAGVEHFAAITLIGGKFHEVKKIFAALGSEVVGLARVRYGPVELPEDLEPGESVEIDLDALLG